MRPNCPVFDMRANGTSSQTWKASFVAFSSVANNTHTIVLSGIETNGSVQSASIEIMSIVQYFYAKHRRTRRRKRNHLLATSQSTQHGNFARKVTYRCFTAVCKVRRIN